LKKLLPTLLFALWATSAFSQDWKEAKSDHFIVYHFEDHAFAKKVIKESERFYKQIAREIGFRRYSNFWTWDNRCKIYIFPTKKTYLEVTGQPNWSGGGADYENRTIFTYRQSENFLISLLPHELTHLIFRDFVGFTGEIPLWLDEGLAQFEEKEKLLDLRSQVKEIVLKENHIPLRRLTQLDVRGSNNTTLVALFYAQASMVVGYLIDEFGSDKFTHFCQQLRDGKPLDEALQFAYPGKFRTIEELEESWVQYVKTF